MKLARTDDARQAYEASLRLVESLARKEPENMQLQRDVSVALDRLGDVCMQAGRAVGSVRAF